MEGLLLALLCLAPWCFGAVHPSFELLLYTGLAALLLLWAVRVLLSWQFSWHKCPVALCLAALFIIAVIQLVPWPNGWIARLSPRTAELYALLLPSQREVLRFASGEETVASSNAGSTISLAPGETQKEAIRLLAIFLLYAVVRSNLTSTAQLRRLSLALLANGLLLSLFAVVQLFSWGLHLLYGLYPTTGTTFGPYINKNHFPYYVNVCLGLGVGLLLLNYEGGSTSRRRSHRSSSGEEKSEEGARRWHRRHSSRRREKGPIQYASADEQSMGLLAPLWRILQQPRTLWLGFSVAILAASIVLSASRAGALAMLGGAMACVLIQARRSTSLLRFGMGAVLIGFAVLGFVAWFGLERVEERWQNLFEMTAETEDLSKVDRIALWESNLASFHEFPIWGTGYGSFQFTELLHRDSPKWEGRFAKHAHNDYLEVLLESGIVGMAVFLVLVGLLLWLGYRAVRRQHHSSASWLATGLFFGLATLLIHSFVDFGLHIPANMLLAVVLCAHLAALGSRSRHAASASSEGGSRDEGTAGQYRGLAPVAAVAVLGMFAVVLVQQGWQSHKAARFLDAANRLKEGVDNPDRERQIAYLQNAVHETPKNPNLCMNLAQAQMSRYLEESSRETAKGMAPTLEQGMASLAGALASPVGLSPAASCAVSLFTQSDWTRREAERKFDPSLLMPALASYVRVRDNCPIVTEPYMRLAAAAMEGKLVRGDSVEMYLNRAKFLLPTNAAVWYICGEQEFKSQRREEAWKSWRRALELSFVHLTEILNQAHPVLSDDELLDKVLPDNAKVLFMAGVNLYPDDAERQKREPFLERALTVLAEQPEAEKPEDQAEDLSLKGMIHQMLGQKQEAILAYQSALIHAPRSKQVAWRMNLARLLFEDGQLREASRQLLLVLNQQPGDAQARAMLNMVRQELLHKNREPAPEK